MKPSVAQWLTSREPGPPEALMHRMLSELAKFGARGDELTPQLLSDAGASILKSLDAAGCTERKAALDLLAADALFTYAFEAASESTQEIADASEYVLKRVTET